MNNWRLLLLAVVAVFQPIGSFTTENNLIDGSQKCCDHRSNSAIQDTRLYGNSPKSTPEDHRLNSQDNREDSRRRQARDDPIRARERLTAERDERRISSNSALRFSTAARFALDQERRQRSVEARESRQVRENQNRRIRDGVTQHSLNRYERDALDSRQIRISRDDSRVGRDSMQVIRNSDDFRRSSLNRETSRSTRATFSQERNDVPRAVNQRYSRTDTFRSGNRVQDNNKVRRSMDQRVRENTYNNRRARSLETRENGVGNENRRTDFRTVAADQVDERRQSDQTRESRNIIATLRDSSESVDSSRRLDGRRHSVEKEDQTRRNIREHRTDERIDNRRQIRDESRLSREKSEGRETGLNAERRQSLFRESRMAVEEMRTERDARSDGRTNARRVETRNVILASRESSNERRASEASRSLRRVKTYETSDERRHMTTSLDKILMQPSVSRFNERQTTVQIPERSARRVERATRNIKSAEREQRHESRMYQYRPITISRESRDIAERRQEIRRTVSPVEVEINTRFERESRIREQRDNVQTGVNRDREERNRDQAVLRMVLDERRNDNRKSREYRVSEQANSDERVERSRIREDTMTGRSDVRHESRDENRDRNGLASRLNVRDVAARLRFDTRSTSRTIQSSSRQEQVLEDRRRQAREQNGKRESRDMIHTSLVRENIDNQRREARSITRDSLVDVRNDVIRNRGVRIGETRSQDRPSQHRTRDVITTRSVDEYSRDTTSRNVDIRAEPLLISHGDRITNEGEDRNNGRVLRIAESRRESRMLERELQPNRHNLAMKRQDRIANRSNREAKLRSDDVLAKDFRNLGTKVGDRDVVKDTYYYDNQNAMSWQMVFYTLQGAYICGLLMQMLTEKSSKEKSRNFTWWIPASKALIKLD